MTGIKDILVGLGYNLKDMGGQWSCMPLYRNSDNPYAVSINKQTGEFYDFVEKTGGSFQTLVERTLGSPLTDELKQKLNSGDILYTKQEVDLEFTKIFDKKLLLKLEKDYTYWNNRGISNRVLEQFGGGVATAGKMMNRYVFPIWDEKQNLIGFSGRYIYKNDKVPRWKHFGQKKSFIYPLFNQKEIFENREVILVESHGDLLNLFENDIRNVIVTFGINISPAIISYLIKLDLNKIIIGFNNDENNNSVGNKAAKQAKKQLNNYFDESQILIALPQNKKDFGEMSKEEILEWKNQLKN